MPPETDVNCQLIVHAEEALGDQTGAHDLRDHVSERAGEQHDDGQDARELPS